MHGGAELLNGWMMRVVTSLTEWKQVRLGIAGTVGVVPTMGFLHEGHLSLVRRARAETGSVVVWIFVNPKQFLPGEDFQAYPRDMERDLKLLEEARADLVLAPGVDEVYPEGFQTTVAVAEVSQSLEGAARPGHFLGVATVVCKIFALTQPHRIYFGQKDAQQCLVVGRMARDLGFLADVVICPTVREADGLAMSSRNVYLTPDERRAAPAVYRALRRAEQALRAGERRAARLSELMRSELGQERLIRVDYVSVAETGALRELDEVTFPCLLSVAVRLGRTRLIDNILLPVRPE